MTVWQWHVLRVRPGSELACRDALHLDMQRHALVPVEIVRRESRRRKMFHVRQPLVPGYVFARLTDADWPGVRLIKGVTGVLLTDARPATLSADQIEAVERLSRAAALPAGSERRALAAGDRVSIRRGPWAELSGVVEMIERGRVVALVDLLGTTSRVRLEPDAVEVAG